MIDKLPDSQLLQFLREKSEARSDVEFDYLDQLADLRHRVSGEVRFINQLFPEYTPHDDEYHLSRLFHVADTLIGAERYALLNATELFILACGLYGHDWGMAVSEAEREYVVSGIVPDGFTASEFALLPDEHQRFERFVKDNGLSLEARRESGISNDDWREYVRATHAYRSGERLRLFFKNIDPGVAEAAGRVCEGHWLNIEEIQDFRRYPTNFAVLRENLDLAAIAVYVRLIDLLDIGHDRTPYVIWKFVAPRDSRSKMEWNKHRALQPITCPTYLNGRIVLVDGSTSDHEVYAALEDLHRYCEAQIRECTDLLARLPDTRPLLDIYHLEWRVVALGFDPVLIQFEFDRDSVLQILSDEIYQGDPYVFLRELLQNSIDAIRMRRELLERYGGIKVEQFGLIKVEVVNRPNGDCIVTWTDDGVGMDAYIVRNYLAVAGKSYYRSEEFERKGLSLDPISKFGVGVLSCFMVASLVEIETRRDPYAGSTSEALRIRIPAINRQFRVERNPPLDFSIGTRVTIHIDSRSLPENTKRLEVTNYLKMVAGFVEFPVIVHENGRTTTVMSPKSEIDPAVDARLLHLHENDAFSIELTYPVDQVVLPQDLDGARTNLAETSFDLRNDFGLTTYEGNISFLTPRDKWAWLGRSYGVAENGLSFSAGEVIVRFKQEWTRNSAKQDGFSKSASPFLSHSIYRNGVLVPSAQIPSFDNRHDFPRPRAVINILSDAAQLDIARTNLNDSHWFQPIQEALERKLVEKLMRELEGSSNKESLLLLGLFFSVYRLGSEFLNKLDLSKLPVAVIKEDGLLEVEKWKMEPVSVFPAALGDLVRELLDASFSDETQVSFFSKWRGGTSILSKLQYGSVKDLRIDTALDLTQDILEQFYVPTDVVLLSPPFEDLKPLVQQIWKPADSRTFEDLDKLASKAVVDPKRLSAEERNILLGVWNPWSRYAFIPFPQRWSPFAVGLFLYNLSHPMGELLFQSIAWLLLRRFTNEKPNAQSGSLSDSINNLIFWRSRGRDLQSCSQALIEAASHVGLAVDNSHESITAEDFWPSSLPTRYVEQWKEHIEPFGEALTT